MDLQERLQEVELYLSNKSVEDAEKDDQIAGFQKELKVRNAQLADLEEKNKKITQECQTLTIRILEEKNKMVEIMNEANNMFEDASRGPSGTLTKEDQSQFNQSM